MNDQAVPSQEAIREELERVLKSTEFARAEYLCRFLRCCVEQSLAGNISQLKEFWLGRSVFLRDKTFDPSADPIVRVQARRLRQKLEHYYENDGRNDAIRIVLPVGTYVPHFLSGEQLKSPNIPQRRALSLAVIPFTDVEKDKAGGRFAAMLTDDLIHGIVETGKFLVVSQRSSARYQGATDDVRVIGKALNADLLIEGRVHGSEAGRSVSVQLTDTASGYHLWSVSLECSAVAGGYGGSQVTRRVIGMLDSGGLRKTATRAAVASDL
jgi:TolB-like protein